MVLVALLLFVMAFGVYLGRFLRWNSWDVLTQAAALFADIADRFVHPLAHGRTWGMTAVLGVLLNFMRVGMEVLSQDRTTKPVG
jgi:uncharacterized membrane protein